MLLMALCATSCSSDPDLESTDGKYKLEFSFSRPTESRATETSFENGDVAGVYVSESSRPLEIAGNILNNEPLTYDGKIWDPTRKLYWNDGTYNIVGYYPYLEIIGSTTDLYFKVENDQRAAEKGSMNAYEKSDFLYASSRNVASSSSPVEMQFRHLLSKLTIRLIKGEDYEGEIPETALVQIHNTVPSSTIDLESGIATKYKYGERETIIARQETTTSYSAILVPQRLENRVPLVEVIMNGVSYLYEGKFVFKPGVHHILNLVIEDNPEKIKIEIGGEIVGWS